MVKNRGIEGGVIRMERVREILRQHELGLNQRSIGRATGVSRSVVQEYLRRALQHGVTYAIAKSLTDEELRGALGKSKRSFCYVVSHRMEIC